MDALPKSYPEPAPQFHPSELYLQLLLDISENMRKVDKRLAECHEHWKNWEAQQRDTIQPGDL